MAKTAQNLLDTFKASAADSTAKTAAAVAADQAAKDSAAKRVVDETAYAVNLHETGPQYDIEDGVVVVYDTADSTTVRPSYPKNAADVVIPDAPAVDAPAATV